MESWDDLVKKSAAERASNTEREQGYSREEAYTGQLEYWKNTLKRTVDLKMMQYLLEDAKSKLSLRGNIHLVDRESDVSSSWSGGYQGRGGYSVVTARVAYGPEWEVIPGVGYICLFASPNFNWERFARQRGNGKTSIKYEVKGSFANGIVSASEEAIRMGVTFNSGRAKELIADNIAEMKTRGLI